MSVLSPTLDVVFLDFTVPGKPVAWQRARLGRNGRHFTAPESVAYKNLVAMVASDHMDRDEVFQGPVALDVSVVLEIPASWSKRKREEALTGQRLPTGRPDVDNVVKQIKDGLRNIAYRDDAQVCEVSARKEYGEPPEVRVRLRSIIAKGNK